MKKKDRTELRSADLKSLKLGRYPWKAGVKYFMIKREPFLSSSTIEENTRKLLMIGNVLTELKSKGIVGTTDPRSMTAGDVEGLLLWMKKHGLEISTREKYLSISNSYLKFFGNSAIEQIRIEQGRILPPKPLKTIHALNIEELQLVFKALDEVGGHKGQILKGMISLAFCTGGRPKEILLSEVRDLDLKNDRFFVRHPKGEESWAAAQWVPLIRGDMLPNLREYKLYRESISCGTYLFPNPTTKKPYSLNSIRKWCREISASTGVMIRLKDMRSTLASLTVKGDLGRLKAVSLQLRHTKLSTTEHFYARINEGEIEHEIGDAWRDNPIE
ncbi:MAG: tyrosine-type recombinase/integrase [Candidatus Methanomethylophilaceae archaeon]